MAGSDGSRRTGAVVTGVIVAGFLGYFGYAIAVGGVGGASAAMPLIFLVFIAIAVGSAAKNRRNAAGRAFGNRTSTFPTPPPPGAPPPPVTGALPQGTGSTFPTPPPAPSMPPPAAPSPMASPTPAASAEPGSPPPDVIARVTELRDAGRTVEAIDLVREATGMELYEASQYIRNL